MTSFSFRRPFSWLKEHAGGMGSDLVECEAEATACLSTFSGLLAAVIDRQDPSKCHHRVRVDSSLRVH